MDKYLLQEIIHTITPYLGATIAVVSGMMIANWFLKDRIYRYANATIQKTLAYQAKKIEHLEEKITEQKEIISDLRAYQKRAKLNAMKIMEGR